MRARAPGRTWEIATSTTILARARRLLATAAILVLTIPLAGVAGGSAPTAAPAAVPALVPVAATFDDRAEIDSMRRQQQRASRDRRQAEQAAAAAAAQVAAQQAAQQAAKRRPAVKKKPASMAARAVRAAPVQRTRRAAETIPAPPADGSRAAVVVAFALAQVGKPYIWASTGPRGYDCSGLVLASFARVGVRLPAHKADDIGTRGRGVPRGQWQAGDVLHWRGHVGIYIGGGKVVHAPGRGRKITVASVWDSPSGRRLL